MPTQDLQTNQSATQSRQAIQGMAMEGLIARWYTKICEQGQELAMEVRQVG